MKLSSECTLYPARCRSREGAWIEIANYNLGEGVTAGRSREGAWIEITALLRISFAFLVAPVRERGLKFSFGFQRPLSHVSRSREGAWIEMQITRKLSKSLLVAPVRERGLK